MPNLTGQSIGRYHILEQLGEGGMAIVYKAYDTRLERNVALKVLRIDQFIPTQLQMVLQRFEREAKSLAKLKHPNIVNILDYGEHEGNPYLVMEYLPGGTLKQKLGQAIPWQEAIKTLLPVARGLFYAHQHGVIHRDVKPANILIDQNEEPILTDFGIAKLLEGTEGHTLTGSGVGIGTPEYMAPEQGIGANTIDARADIYSLGIVLYEMVTGRKPYIADTPMAVVLKQMTDPLPSPTDFVPDLPEDLEQILFKALAKQPEDRFTNMGALITAMEQLLAATQRVEIPALSPPTRHSKKVIDQSARLSSRKIGAIFGILGILVITILTIVLVPKSQFIAGLLPTTTAISSPTKAITPTTPPSPTATPLPFAWTRLNSGQFLPRDIITAIVVSPYDPDIIYVGTQNSGIYKSIDGGKSWQSVNHGLNRVMISSLVIDAENPNNLYTGTRSGRLFASHDAGNTWKDITPESVISSDTRSYILMDPFDPARLYYSDSWNIYQSTNQGSSWLMFNRKCAINNINAITLQRNSKDEAGIYVSQDSSNCKAGIYRVSNLGITWKHIGPDDSSFRQFWQLMVIMNSSGERVILGMQGSDELFVSMDDGQSWDITTLQCDLLYTNSSAAVFCGHREGLSVSRDGGISWQKLAGMDDQVSAIWASADLDKIILGTTTGIVISNDGGKTWENQSSGLGIRRLELDVSPDGSQLFVRDRTQAPLGAGYPCCSGQNEVYFSFDGQNWELVTSQGYGFAIDADAHTLYRAQENSLLVSSDKGQTWKKETFPFWVDRSDLGLFAHPKQSGLLYAADDNERILFISDDSGFTWIEYPQNEHLAYTQLFFGQENTVYMVPFYESYRSVDGGKTWKECGGGDFTVPSMRRFAIDPRDDNRVFIASIEKGLLYSSNACQTWETHNKGLDNQFINSIIRDPVKPDTLYLGTDGGVYISFDNGLTWGQANNGLLDTTVVYSIVVDKDGNVFAATPNGIYILGRK